MRHNTQHNHNNNNKAKISIIMNITAASLSNEWTLQKQNVLCIGNQSTTKWECSRRLQNFYSFIIFIWQYCCIVLLKNLYCIVKNNKQSFTKSVKRMCFSNSKNNREAFRSRSTKWMTVSCETGYWPLSCTSMRDWLLISLKTYWAQTIYTVSFTKLTR